MKNIYAINEVQQILYYITEYMNGNEEYYEELLGIIDGINLANKHYKKEYKKLKFYLDLSTIISWLSLNSKEEVYNELNNFSYDDLELLRQSISDINDYLKVSNKKGEFPDLDVAFLLTNRLNELIESIVNYQVEMTSMDEKIANGCIYFYRSDIKKNKEELNDEINSMRRVLRNEQV